MKIIEATLIMPLSCLIIVSLIGIAMSFYSHFSAQVIEHEEVREKIYSVREVNLIRTYRLMNQAMEKEE